VAVLGEGVHHVLGAEDAAVDMVVFLGDLGDEHGQRLGLLAGVVEQPLVQRARLGGLRRRGEFAGGGVEEALAEGLPNLFCQAGKIGG